jgi:spore germination cell wall hydrolase CwlJ-like protein
MGPRVPDDPDMKQTAALPAAAVPGVTVAGKGQVTGDDRRPKSPAERLNLSGIKRAKAEKCLSNAVYFESRSEPVRGQIAVAQVVMNRVFSGYYPGDVCGVVYQNAHRHLACQFTFACDRIPDIVTDQESWARAQRIARETLDGKLWLPEIAKSTHYHASYVHPYWVRAMKKNSKIGLHNFYRPRKWGDGSDEPSWGSATYTADAAAKM